MLAGERQVAPSLEGIRRDHVARYEWAATRLGQPCRVVDLACGIGYGSKILADAGHGVLGIDGDGEALAYGRLHYAHEGVVLAAADAERLPELGEFDAAVCFETIEHVEDPLPMLRALRDAAPLLIASVPNEDVMPWRGHAFHYRHYRPAEFKALLAAAGWAVSEWYGQAGRDSEVERDRKGRTMIAVAVRAEPEPARVRAEESPAPEHVAIVGLGPSVMQYVGVAMRHGARGKVADELWAINALGDVLQCDRIFHMDDVRIQEIRAAAAPESNIAAMLAWLKRHPGPIYTSQVHPDYPGLVPFPLEDVANSTGMIYFNSTAAYAIAYAIHIGVKKISIFGMDFTYPDAHDAERGRGCVEFWLGLAHARGIKIAVSKTSTLLDAYAPLKERVYGYDAVHVGIAQGADGRMRIEFEPREQLPTAEEIERAYDHSVYSDEFKERSGSANS